MGSAPRRLHRMGFSHQPLQGNSHVYLLQSTGVGLAVRSPSPRFVGGWMDDILDNILGHRGHDRSYSLCLVKCLRLAV